MDAPTTDLYRGLMPAVSCRANGDGEDEMPTLDITFARFGVWNEINSLWEGRFLERLDRGAFAKTIAERGDAVKVLFNHGHDSQVGEKVLGSIDDLGERKVGPYVIVDMFDTSYNADLLPGLRAGAYGASYRFSVVKEEWFDPDEPSDDNPQMLPERTISEVKLYEAGPVTFPADEGTTVGVRSLTDRFREGTPSRPAHSEPLTPNAEPPPRHSPVTTLTPEQVYARSGEWNLVETR